jgi:hypothetical protein
MCKQRINQCFLSTALTGDASRSARNSAGTAAAAAGKKARHATSMASPLISAARTDLQDTEKKTNKVHHLLLGGKKKTKKKKKNGEKLTNSKEEEYSDIGSQQRYDMNYKATKKNRQRRTSFVLCVCLRTCARVPRWQNLFFRQVVCEWSVQGRPEKKQKNRTERRFSFAS